MSSPAAQQTLRFVSAAAFPLPLHRGWMGPLTNARRAQHEAVALPSREELAAGRDICFHPIRAHSGFVFACAVLVRDDERFLVTGGGDSVLHMLHIPSMSTVSTLRGHTGHVNCVVAHPHYPICFSGPSSRRPRRLQSPLTPPAPAGDRILGRHRAGVGPGHAHVQARPRWAQSRGVAGAPPLPSLLPCCGALIRPHRPAPTGAGSHHDGRRRTPGQWRRGGCSLRVADSDAGGALAAGGGLAAPRHVRPHTLLRLDAAGRARVRDVGPGAGAGVGGGAPLRLLRQRRCVDVGRA